VQQVTTETLVAASTVGATDSTTLSCSVGNSPDVTFDWIVPKTGFYTVSTEGSSFDTVLGLRADACDGTELGCVDDSPAGMNGALVQRFVVGQRVAIVVDGKAGTEGDVALHLDPVTCPAQDLTEQPMPVSLTTLGGTNTFEGSCGGAGRSERSYSWVAPSDGLFRFTVTTDAFDPALYVLDGPLCDAPILGCNASGAGALPAEVTRHLTAGQAVTLVVDSVQGAGVFTLDAQKLSDTCPGADLPNPADTPITATINDGDPSVITASCAPTGIVMIPNGTHIYGDRTYSASIGAGKRCGYRVEADGPVAVFVLAGDLVCGGAEEQCAEAADDGTGLYVAEGHLGSVTADESQNYVLVVRSLTSSPVSITVGQTACMMI